jgi:hypothetical protein
MTTKIRKILLITLVFSSLILFPISFGSTTKYPCPDTKAGDTKILKVTVVEETGLEAMFGSNWKTVLNNTFGGEASELGARSKSVVKSINKTEQYNSTFYNIFFMMYLGIGVVEACNITTDYWDFTTGDFNSTPDQESASAYSIKDTS